MKSINIMLLFVVVFDFFHRITSLQFQVPSSYKRKDKKSISISERSRIKDVTINNSILLSSQNTQEKKVDRKLSGGLNSSDPIITPSLAPTDLSIHPNCQPSNTPSIFPSLQPSMEPSQRPSEFPSASPSSSPTFTPCSACASGQFYSVVKGFFSGVVGCTACSPGYSCSGACALPQPCGTGTYADQYGLSACSPCASGSYTVTNGTVTCNPCPSGYSCPQVSAKPSVCLRGTFSLSASTACTACQSGSYAPLSGMSACLPCPGGAACVSAAINPVNCRNGYYSPSMSSACSLCPSGSYAIGGQSACTACPPGFACAPNSATLTLCTNGTFSIGQQAVCTSCPPGYACPSTTSGLMIPCDSGYYSTGGKSSCLPCPNGSYCPHSESPPVPCPPGTSSNPIQALCTPASPGYYAPVAGMTQAVVCGVGLYSVGGASVCSLCAPGYRCASGSSSDSPAGSACPIGGYCNPATSFTLCLPGTYGVLTAGISQQQACAACPAGSLCPSPGTILPTVCPVGGFCPAGSASMVGCSVGTFSQNQGQSLPSTCISCTEGYYCPFIGTSEPQICPVNYFCPTGTSSYLLNPCPRGTYSTSPGLISSSQCILCPPGSWCVGGKVTLCAEGSYNPLAGGGRNSSCVPCEPGYACPSAGMDLLTVPCESGFFCPRGSSSAYAHPCPAGKFSDDINLASASGCSTCPARSACPLGSTTAMIEPCRAGAFCPQNTPLGNEPLCLAGTYSNLTSLASADECSPCPGGRFCSGGSTAPNGECYAGYVCPPRSTIPQQVPCPAGSYSTLTGLYDVTQCLPCPPGYSCVEACTVPLPCAAGKYSSEGLNSSALCLLCPAGHWCRSGEVDPQPCGTKYYSDTGASACTLCPSGHYCASNTTTASQMQNGGGVWSRRSDLAGVCFNGTYCGVGVGIVPDLTRFACPIASYCPAGTPFPILCPAGTISVLTGLSVASECLPTPAGFYSVAGSSSPTGKAAPGYYCVEGSMSATAAACPPSTYNPKDGGTSEQSCRTCSSGWYCLLPGTMAPIICPLGFFCPPATSAPLPCNQGSYGNITGLEVSSDCTPCDGGMYCNGYGLTRPTGLIAAGFYSISASKSATPGWNGGRNTSSVRGVCVPGAYCPQGSAYPIACPAGYYNSNYGSTSIQACTPCDPGTYCAAMGLTQPTGLCTEGYYCSLASTSQTQHMTVPGYFTLVGAGFMSPCPPGTFSSNFAQTYCAECPSSYYCPNSTQTSYSLLCPKGNYCSSGSSIPTRCPVGTFSPHIGNSLVTDCSTCTPGSWCGQPGLSAVSGLIEAGFYSMGGAQTAILYTITATGGPCFPGHYCMKGAAYPTPCPQGTYAASTMGTGNITFGGINYFCNLCPPGRVCEGVGLTAPSALCPGGFWCLIGTPSIVPICSDAPCQRMYGICPIGHSCPPGTSTPIPCSGGSFMNSTGAARCVNCLAGYYCDSTVSTSRYLECPQGYFCPAGTALNFQLCGAGTYGSRPGLRSAQECTLCSIGTYNPLLGSLSSDACTPCPPSYFCNSSGISNYTHWPCPSGAFCLEKTTTPTPCPEGTYNPNSYGARISDCLQCPVGRMCRRGASIPEACPSGSFCAAGSSSNSSLCPESFYCLESCTVPILCPSSHYCPLGNAVPTPCARGSFCPAGSKQPTPCPLGFKAATSSNASFISLDSVANACTPCDPGYYGNDEARLHCFAGLPGYVYLGGTKVAKPVNITTDRGYMCGAGGYCPAMTGTSATLCPAGTYQPLVAQGDASSCLPCPAGTYQSFVGSSVCLSCSSSSVSRAGATQCTCVGQNRAFQPGDGWCTCKPGYEFIDTITQVVSSDSDGVYDCQPIVYPRCIAPQKRDSSGNCVAPDSFCASKCASSGGILSTTTGLCACNQVVHLEDVCNSKCRNSTVIVSCDPASDSLLIDDPVTGQIESIPLSSFNLMGSFTCTASSSRIYSISAANGTFSGIYGFGQTIASKASYSLDRRLSVNILDSIYGSHSISDPFSTRLLASSNAIKFNASAYPRLPQPLVCISQNDSIVFDISSHEYPVYRKDSLVNTNPNFDYSSFRNLQILATQSSILNNFSFTFISPGVYEFSMSSSSANLIIIVTPPSEQCVTAGPFVEASQSNMIQSGVSSTSDLVLSPDWTLVIGLVVGVFLVINLVAGFLYYFRKKSWDIASTSSQQSYRSKYNIRKQALTATSTSSGLSFALRKGNSMVVPTDLDSFSPVGIAEDVNPDPLLAESITAGGAQTADINSTSWRVIPVDKEFGPAKPDENEEEDSGNEEDVNGMFEEEEGRIPELIRQVQINQKALDVQLSSHSNQLLSVQRTLHSEIEELKQLITLKQAQSDRDGDPQKYQSITNAAHNTLLEQIISLLRESSNRSGSAGSIPRETAETAILHTAAQESVMQVDVDDQCSEMPFDETSDSDKLIHAMLSDYDLTVEQKEVILDVRESDLKRMNSFLDAETRNHEETLRQTLMQDRPFPEDPQIKSSWKAQETLASYHTNTLSEKWRSQVRECYDEATELGLLDIERENYCFSKLFDADSCFIPEDAVNEVITRIQNSRHSAEMGSLLSSLFLERIEKLQSAVGASIDEKLVDLIRLVRLMAMESVDSETMRARLADFEVSYTEKLRTIELEVIRSMEGLLLNRQLELRQRQLTEISNAVHNYSTPKKSREVVEAVPYESNAAWEEELTMYLAQLETEKNARMERFQIQREETERQIKLDLTLGSTKMKDKPVNDNRIADEELECRHDEHFLQNVTLVLRQESQSEEEQRRIDSAKKAQAAEEVLDQERLAQKAKLQSRLRQRRTGASVII